MKTVKFLLITITFLFSNISFLHSQNTEGTEFWLTFGRNLLESTTSLQIRIVGGAQTTTGTIYFTNIDTTIDFTLQPYEIFDYNLTSFQIAATYNVVMGKTNFSIRINTSNSVAVYAFNYLPNSTYDVTNVLPIEALGTEYYQISYIPIVPGYVFDAYAVVATQNNTQLYHNGVLIPEVLNIGDVYYRTSNTDMTGNHITSNKPVAFFAVNQSATIPYMTTMGSHLMQQLPPVNTWDKTFFVPVAVTEENLVRIVVSQNYTTISQKGGKIRTDIPGAQTTLSFPLQAGQFVELEIYLDSAGCYIQADKPVGVCAYLTNDYGLNQRSNISQSCIPGLAQKITSAKLAPFIPNVSPIIQTHYILIFTSTDAKNNTKVSINGGVLSDLSGGVWIDNAVAGVSFYNMPVTNETASYFLTNPDGFIIMGAGIRTTGSGTYYFLAGSAMRNLEVAFYANDIHCGDLENNQICEKEISFRAEIENIGVEVDSIKWYINGVEFEPAQNQETWNYTFTQVGEFKITMVVYYFENGETKTKTITGTLKRKDLWVKMRNIKH